jgi:large subunit ribosomal protein L9
MEVLLLQDIVHVGKKNDLIVVGDGYALNFLLPQRLALVATPVVRKRFAEAIRKRAEEREMEKQAQQGVATALAGKTVRFTKKASKTGKLYAAISESAIAAALKEQHKLDVPEGAIVCPSPIKALGTFPVNVEIAGQTLQVNVLVEAEKAAK